MALKKTFLVFILVNLLRSLDTAACPLNQVFGETSTTIAGTLDTVTGYGYLQGDPTYEVTCCGYVESWTANYQGVTGSHPISFQVWRLVSGSTYELIGEDDFTITANNEQTLTSATRPNIQSGDKWGWYSSGTDIIPYKATGNEKDVNYLYPALGDLAVGATTNWGTITPIDDRSYGVRMNVGQGSTPSFSNLPATKTISNNEASGTVLETLVPTDTDTSDTLTVVMVTSTTEFSFSSLVLSVATLTTMSGNVELEFEVTDSCGLLSTSTYTVSIYNDPPVFYNSPLSTTLNEDVTLETQLFTISVNDSGDTITCDFAASVPGTYPFEIRLIPSTSTYGIYSQGNPGFSYTTLSTYNLPVDCTDSVTSVQGTYIVYLVENVAPNITNLQGSTTINTTEAVGTTVFTVISTDAENDNLNYTMTCSPTACPFEIFDSGQIQLNQDLTGHTTVGYDLFITVTDGRNTVGPKTLTVTIADINDPVSITNLPLGGSFSVSENTAAATSVFQVSFSDLDSSQTHTWTMTSSPGAGISYFTIDQNGLISTTSSILNFEALATTSYTFSVTVADPVTSSSQDIVIDVVNVNEAPVFSQSSYGLSTTEGSAGTVIGTPSFGVTDPDAGDSLSLAMDCGTSSNYFYMTPSSGQIQLQSDYDLDTGSLATTVVCGVTATDSLGLTSTASLTIFISDINDNTPQFIPDSYSFFVNYYATSGTLVGTTTASDGDSGTFGTLTYALNQASIGVEQFSVDTNGAIYVQVSPDSGSSGVNYSTSHTLTLTATDGGGLSDTATVVIIISDTTTTSSTTTTERYKTFFEDPNNLAWFVPCLIVLAIAVLFTGFIAFTCRGKYGCKPFLNQLKEILHCKQRRIRRMNHPKYDSSIQTVRKPPPPVQMQSWRTKSTLPSYTPY